jgi:hypothetical protein
MMAESRAEPIKTAAPRPASLGAHRIPMSCSTRACGADSDPSVFCQQGEASKMTRRPHAGSGNAGMDEKERERWGKDEFGGKGACD